MSGSLRKDVLRRRTAGLAGTGEWCLAAIIICQWPEVRMGGRVWSIAARWAWGTVK